MSNTYILSAILIMAAVTAILRFLPFAVFNGKNTPHLIVCLGQSLPYAVMGMLVVYCLKGISFTAAENYIPALAASVVVVGSYIVKRNTLLSILAGTACYMILVQTVFA